MSSLEELRQSLPEFARDIKVNLGALLGEEGLPELTPQQKWGTALAAAIASRQPGLSRAVEDSAPAGVDEAVIAAARTAATLMAMTNIYYRAVHMAQDPELSRLSAGLRMNGLAQHGIAQLDFELFGLAASVVTGCEGCTRAHIGSARKHGGSSQMIQAVLRIAAVIHAGATVLDTRIDAADPAALPMQGVNGAGIAARHDPG